jgi:transglutaminase-like putative cysteine protease
MKRREFLASAGAVSAALAFPKTARLLAENAVVPAHWRTFEVTTSVEILNPTGATRVWLPMALLGQTPFQKTVANAPHAEGGKITTMDNKADYLGIVAAEFPAGVKPVLTLTSRVSTQNYAADLSAPNPQKADAAELKHFLRATKLIPTDGIVKTKALEITKGATTDVDKARAIYEWIVENTFRDPKTRGCGLGDIRFMLETGDLGGKCADLNALFVGLARAAGVPARDVYGIRIAKSDLGYKSLGTASETITGSQHCRAEVYLSGHGWVPVDPADVRKVVLEEPPGNRPLDDEMVTKARARLFGSWEMNWMAYNFGHDVSLPQSTGAPLAFFMYPQAEMSNGERIDCLAPNDFKYEIKSREIV